MLAAFKTKCTILLANTVNDPFFPHDVLGDHFGGWFSSSRVIQGLGYFLSYSYAIPSGFGALCWQPEEEAREGWGGVYPFLNFFDFFYPQSLDED